MQNRRYFYLTALIALVIFVACLLMAGPMRPGLPVITDWSARLLYIQQHLGWWQLGWLCWMASALGLLTFCCLLSTTLPATPWRTLALTLVGLGLVPDLIAETLYAFVFPALIAQESSMALLQLVDVTAIYLTGFLGNGLYNLGGLGLTLLMWQQYPQLKAWLLPGFVAWMAGLGLSVAIALQQLGWAEALTAFSMALSTAWFVLIAYRLWGKADV